MDAEDILAIIPINEAGLLNATETNVSDPDLQVTVLKPTGGVSADCEWRVATARPRLRHAVRVDFMTEKEEFRIIYPFSVALLLDIKKFVEIFFVEFAASRLGGRAFFSPS